MDKILTVARREVIETVRTKTFIFSVVLMPMLIMGTIFGIKRFSEMAGKEQISLRKIAVVDETGRVFENLKQEVNKYNVANAHRPFELEAIAPESANVEGLRQRIRDGKLYAYMVIREPAITAEAPCILGRKDNRLEEGRIIRDIVGEAIIRVRFETHTPPLNRDEIQRIQRPVPIETVDVQTNEKATGDEMARTMTPFVFMFLLYMGTMGISQGLLTSLIEEKSSRVLEVLLSAISPGQLMAGKILGMTTIGVILLGVWTTVGYFSARYSEMGYLVTGMKITYAALYFFPGFLLMAAALAAVGSVCNTLKDAQSMVMPLNLLMIIPMMLWMLISQNPQATFAVVLSYIPPITPYVMMLRLCADPDTPVWQVITSLAVLWGAGIGMIWAGAKIFRIGVLMYGKPPTPREMLRWLKYA